MREVRFGEDAPRPVRVARPPTGRQDDQFRIARHAPFAQEGREALDARFPVTRGGQGQIDVPAAVPGADIGAVTRVAEEVVKGVLQTAAAGFFQCRG